MQPGKRARAPRVETLADTDAGARIKRTRTKEDHSSEKAEQILSELQSTHLSDVLPQQQPNIRTVQEYADSGLRALEITCSQPSFPPVGFALPAFEPQISPTAWKAKTYTPEGGKSNTKETMEG